MLTNVTSPHVVALVWVRLVVPLAQFAGVWVTTQSLYESQPVPLALVQDTPLSALGVAAQSVQLDVEP